MSFPFHIARRYIISKKSHHSINIISGISVLGVVIATAALVCILSVFTGFEGMVASLFTTFDPPLKVVTAEGKYFDSNDARIEQVRHLSDVRLPVDVVEDKALVTSKNAQLMVTVKGVDDHFLENEEFNDILVGNGVLDLHAVDVQYGIFGVNVLTALGLNIDFEEPIQVYAPKKGEKINIANPMNDFRQAELFTPHVAFMVMQSKYDSNYVITSLDFAQGLFDKTGKQTALELYLNDDADVKDVKKKVEQTLGAGFDVLDRYEQQSDTFKIMEIEKLISYVFLTFILLIACFNIIGSLSMLIIDKREDIRTLHNLGATNRDISRIFLLEGWLISLIGALLGIALGVGLCLLQQQYGILKFGASAGSYIVDAYPVQVKLTDVVLVFITVSVIGLLSVLYPVHHFSKKQLKARQ